jgi:hypothetical protein
MPIQVTVSPACAVLRQRDLIRSFGNVIGGYLMDAAGQPESNLVDIDCLRQLGHD